MAGSITGITALQQQPLDVLEGRQAQIVKYQKKLQRLLVRGGSHFFFFPDYVLLLFERKCLV